MEVKFLIPENKKITGVLTVLLLLLFSASGSNWPTSTRATATIHHYVWYRTRNKGAVCKHTNTYRTVPHCATYYVSIIPESGGSIIDTCTCTIGV
jgi:hypothetical protein